MNLPDGRLLTYEVREVVAYFGDVTGFESAVEALERHGIRRAHINMMGSHDAVKEKLGHHFLGGMEVDAESSAPQAIFSDKRVMVNLWPLAFRFTLAVRLQRQWIELAARYSDKS